MKFKYFLVVYVILSISYSQVYLAKEWSRDKALYKAKEYVMTEIIGVNPYVTKFEIDPLAAASSGELTTLVYKCEQKKISGLVLGFYGNKWNEYGTVYQAFAFKNFNEKKALEMLATLDKHISDHTKYLKSDYDNNNFFFKFDDLTFLVYYVGFIKIRVFWNGFDSEWESKAYERTKKRFEKKIKN